MRARQVTSVVARMEGIEKNLLDKKAKEVIWGWEGGKGALRIGVSLFVMWQINFMFAGLNLGLLFI